MDLHAFEVFSIFPLEIQKIEAKITGVGRVIRYL
jgi:hypothetical protein